MAHPVQCFSLNMTLDQAYHKFKLSFVEKHLIQATYHAAVGQDLLQPERDPGVLVVGGHLLEPGHPELSVPSHDPLYVILRQRPRVDVGAGRRPLVVEAVEEAEDGDLEPIV